MQYHRRLPHWQPDNAVFFITVRLHGSLPMAVIEQLKAQYALEKQAISGSETDLTDKQVKLVKAGKRHFARFDQQLDSALNGPYWLENTEVAQIVRDCLHFLDGRDYQLIAYCLMSNHLHLVIDRQGVLSPVKPLFRVMQSLKRVSAGKANALLQRTGAFWQAESYDHVVRNPAELKRIITYTLNNPVKAGLIESWNEWPHSYVRDGYM